MLLSHSAAQPLSASVSLSNAAFVFCACSEWPVYGWRFREIRLADGLGGALQAQRPGGGVRQLGVFQTGELGFLSVQVVELKHVRVCNISQVRVTPPPTTTTTTWMSASCGKQIFIDHFKTGAALPTDWKHCAYHWVHLHVACLLTTVMCRELIGSSLIFIAQRCFLSVCPVSHTSPPEWMQQTLTAEWSSWTRPRSSSRMAVERRAKRASGKSLMWALTWMGFCSLWLCRHRMFFFPRATGSQTISSVRYSELELEAVHCHLVVESCTASLCSVT